MCDVEIKERDVQLVCLRYISCCEYICDILHLENIGLALEGNIGT